MESLEKTAEAFLKIITAPGRGIANFATDAATRAYLAAKNDLNYDIIKSGTQLESTKDLNPGDILLKQGGVDVKNLAGKHGVKEGVSLIIDGVQIVTNRSNHKYLGAGLLGHAAIYIGDDKIAESISEGCIIRPINDEYNKAFNFYAIRPRNNQLASKIAELAKHYASTKRISYSLTGLPLAVIGETKSSNLGSDQTKLKRQILDEGDKTSMFCSEFVTFILNCATDDLKISRILTVAQDRITPEEIYVKLRDHPNFFYVGELHKNVR